jgi:hypothetical protein
MLPAPLDLFDIAPSAISSMDNCFDGRDFFLQWFCFCCMLSSDSDTNRWRVLRRRTARSLSWADEADAHVLKY